MTHPGCTQRAAVARTLELTDRARRAGVAQDLRGAVRWAEGERPIAVTIRFAGAGDAAALRTLAQLDSALALTVPALVAEVDGELRAALSLADGRLIADPFHATTTLAELLRTRARQLGDRGRSGFLTALLHPRRTVRAIRGAVGPA